jgi:elongation factor Ts
MADISAKLVMDLRGATGAGMMDCKKALIETNGDYEKAVDHLRKAGIAKAAKKSGRIAAEGKVFSYIHGDGKIGVLAEINCETDFVARTEKFEDFCKNVCLHICAMKPEFVSDSEIPAETIEKEKEIYSATDDLKGKPENIIEKIVTGRIEKYKKEVCLLTQPFVKDQNKNISDYIKETIAELGENISVRRFVRWEMGEGIAKKEDNLACEVAKAMSEAQANA